MQNYPRGVAKCDTSLRIFKKYNQKSNSVGSTGKCKISDLFEEFGFGVEKPSLFRGLRFNFLPTFLIYSSEKSLKLEFLGMYCLISLLTFSTAPFCHEQ